MKKIILLLLGIIAATALTPMSAQEILPQLKRERPDMKEIKRETQDPTSKYFYPRLMEEYQRNDTTMKLDKYRRLYLGYVFQEDYTPYRSSEHPLSFKRVFESEKLSRQECDSVIAYATKNLADNPFDLREMTLLINAYREKGKTNLANIWQYKLNYLLMAIVSTGTGLDEENAWFVIEPQHEYVLLNMMGYTVDGQLFYDPYYEYIEVKDPSGNDAGGFYFNIKDLLDQYYLKHPDEI